MAQQVTTNTDSLLNLIASTTSSSYADSSANQFASALDTATKAYNQQATGVNTSKTDFSADSSDKLFTSNKNNTSNSSDYVNNNSSNNKPLTDSETNQSDNSQKVNNQTTIRIIMISMQTQIIQNLKLVMLQMKQKPQILHLKFLTLYLNILI